MRQIREEDPAIQKLLRFWPLVIVLFSGIAAYFNLSYTVGNLKEQAENRQKNLDTQREKRTEEMETIRTRLTRLEDFNSLSKMSR